MRAKAWPPIPANDHRSSRGADARGVASGLVMTSVPTPALRLPPLELCIGGEWRPAASGRQREIVDPANGRVIASVADAGAEDIDAAVRAAQAARSSWGQLAASDRGRILW